MENEWKVTNLEPTSYTMRKVANANPSINLYHGDGTVENCISVSKKGITYRGQTIEDEGQAYEMLAKALRVDNYTLAPEEETHEAARGLNPQLYEGHDG